MKRSLPLIFALVYFLSDGFAATSHAYVASGNANSPLPLGSFASLNPVTGRLGKFSFGPSMPAGVAASPDGSQIWVVNDAADGTGQIEIVSVNSGNVLATVALPDVPETGVALFPATILFRHDGKAAFVVFPVGNEGDSDELYLIDAQTYQITGSLALTDFFGGIAVSPDDTQLCLYANGISVYNAATLALIGSIPVGSSALAFAGPTLLSGGSNDLLFINTTTFSVIGTVALTGGPDVVLTTDHGSTAYVYEESPLSFDVVDTTSMTLTANVPISTQFGSLILSPNGSYLIGESYENSPPIYEYAFNTATFDLMQTPLICVGLPFYIGDTLYFYYGSSVMTIVDIANQAVVRQLPIGPNYNLLNPGSAAYNTNRFKSEVLVASNDSTVVIDAATQEISAVLPYTADGSYGVFSGVALAGDQLYTVGFYGLISNNLRTGVSTQLPFPNGGDCLLNSSGLDLSPDHKYLFVPYYSVVCDIEAGYAPPNGTSIYTTANNQLVTNVPAGGPAIAFSPGSKLAYIAGGSTIDIVSTETFTIVKTVQFSSSSFTNIVLSPDGLTLYGLSNNTIAVINLENDQIVNQLPVATGSSPWSLAITSDGSTLLISNLSTPNETKLGLMSTATGALTYVETGSLTAGVVAAQ